MHADGGEGGRAWLDGYCFLGSGTRASQPACRHAASDRDEDKGGMRETSLQSPLSSSNRPRSA